MLLFTCSVARRKSTDRKAGVASVSVGMGVPESGREPAGGE